MSGQLPISLLVQRIGWQSTLITLSILGLILAFLILNWINYKKPKAHHSDAADLTSTGGTLSIIKSSQTWFIALYALLMWAPMSGFASLWGVTFLEKYDGLSSSSAAFLCSLMWLGLAACSPALGYISTRFKNRKLPLVFSALVGSTAFALLVSVKLPSIILAILLLVAGAACAGQALSFSVVKENNPDGVAATAIAFNNMAVVISGAIFQPAIGWILQHFHGDEIYSLKLGVSLILAAYLLSTMISMLFVKESFPSLTA
jgi:predicted MFS family arabinose efflux permease